MTTKRAAEPTEFDHAWERVTKGGGAVVRAVAPERVHLHTAGGLDVVFTVADAPALRAAVALLEGYRGRT
jgi:hypothetical protein